MQVSLQQTLTPSAFARQPIAPCLFSNGLKFSFSPQVDRDARRDMCWMDRMKTIEYATDTNAAFE
jgi:hypothetical protein